MSRRTKRAIITRASERSRSRALSALALTLSALALTLAAPLDARAEGDGLYGKWDSQAQLGLTLGAGSHHPGGASWVVDGGLRLRLLDAFGPTFAVSGGPGRREAFSGFEL